MINNSAELHDFIKIEKVQYQKLGYKGKIHAIITQCEIGKIAQYAQALRKDEYYTNCSSKNIFNRILHLYWRRRHNVIGWKLGISIPVNTFGKGLIIYHSQSIIVHKDVRCGEYCKLHGMNCIGNNGVDEVDNTPIIGNNLDLGVGAVIIGNVRLGDNIKVAANAVVSRSCLIDGSILIGIPARERSN